MTTVQELRDRLEQQGYSVEQVENIKGKANLERELKKVEETVVEILDDLEEIPEEKSDIISECYDKNGHINNDKLLAKLTDKEKVRNHPTVSGLRRLINDYIGYIIRNISRVVQCPTPDNKNRATVEVEVEIQFYTGLDIIVSGCADVCSDNTPSPFHKHPVATAESRAEGRAYRKALNLNITTAEEMGDFTETVIFEIIQDSQITMIKNVCKRCYINLTKFLVKYNLDEDTLSKASNQDGQDMCRQLSEYQSLEEIPEDIQEDDS